jgi:competence protein ComEC
MSFHSNRESPLVGSPGLEFARSPLVLLAGAVTLGICTDRYVGVSIPGAFAVAIGCVVGWYLLRGRPRVAVLLWLAFGSVAAVYHHVHRQEFPPDDLTQFAQVESPVLRVRGVLADEPFTRKQGTIDPLAVVRKSSVDLSLLEIQAVQVASQWESASGTVRLLVERDLPASAPPLNGLHSGDTVQVVGRFYLPQTPGNPGERDARSYSLDKRIRGDLRVSDTTAAVVRIEPGCWSANSLLSWLKQHSTATIAEHLGEARSPVGRALLLGDGNAMERTEWEIFVRTGVVHVLAISGQHLVLLAAFVWFLLGLAGVPRHRAAWLVAFVVFGYAFITGLRPSALRAAVMVSSVCGAIVLRRPVMVANSFALAWLVVLCVNPTDLFDLGSRLSFLSVFVLVWGIALWVTPKPLSPIEQLIQESRSSLERGIRAVVRAIGTAYFVNLVLFLVNTPLLIAEQNIVSPVSLIIGPPLVLLTSIALVAGFLLLLLAPVPILADVLAFVTRTALAACEQTVVWADAVPGGSVFVPGIPNWWLSVFYLLVGMIVLFGWQRTKLLQLLLLAWVVAGLIPTTPRPTDELRLAFLAVGHGGCVVMETPDGRCLLYDVGNTAGPDIVRRVIAPYLWHRGIRRLDEVFISHADADHFNGLVQLARRFPIGRVSLTPSFAEKPTREVEETIRVLKADNVELRTIHAGQSFTAGDVAFDVLHPPPVGPPGAENERSLVLAVRHAGHTILLTGDLEKAGTDQVLNLQPMRVDLMQAPHHGSRAAFPKRLSQWANPRWVVVNRGNLYANFITEADTGVPTWDTHTLGALTVRSHSTGLTVEAFRTQKIEVVRGR